MEKYLLLSIFNSLQCPLFLHALGSTMSYRPSVPAPQAQSEQLENLRQLSKELGGLFDSAQSPSAADVTLGHDVVLQCGCPSGAGASDGQPPLWPQQPDGTQSEAIYAHSVVLAARSQFFSAMFSTGMHEASSRVIHFPSLSAFGVAAVVKFLYTGIVDVGMGGAEAAAGDLPTCDGVAAAAQVLAAAHYLNVGPVEEAARAYLLRAMCGDFAARASAIEDGSGGAERSGSVAHGHGVAPLTLLVLNAAVLFGLEDLASAACRSLLRCGPIVLVRDLITSPSAHARLAIIDAAALAKVVSDDNLLLRESDVVALVKQWMLATQHTTVHEGARRVWAKVRWCLVPDAALATILSSGMLAEEAAFAIRATHPACCTGGASTRVAPCSACAPRGIALSSSLCLKGRDDVAIAYPLGTDSPLANLCDGFTLEAWVRSSCRSIRGGGGGAIVSQWNNCERWDEGGAVGTGHGDHIVGRTFTPNTAPTGKHTFALFAAGRGGASSGFRLVVGNGREDAATGYPRPKYGEWTHYAAVFDGSHAKVYIDGELLSERVVAEPCGGLVDAGAGAGAGAGSGAEVAAGATLKPCKTVNTLQPFAVGNSGYLDVFLGEIAEVRVWKGVVPPDVISAGAVRCKAASGRAATDPWGVPMPAHTRQVGFSRTVANDTQDCTLAAHWVFGALPPGASVCPDWSGNGAPAVLQGTARIRETAQLTHGTGTRTVVKLVAQQRCDDVQACSQVHA